MSQTSNRNPKDDRLPPINPTMVTNMAPQSLNKQNIQTDLLSTSDVGEVVANMTPTTQSITSRSSMTGTPKVKSPFNCLRMGIFTASTRGSSEHIIAVSNPASTCMVVAVATFDPCDTEQSLSSWCKCNRLGEKHDLKLGYGEQGFQEILNDSTIEGVFITGAFDRGHYAELALRANKHVLVDDPITTSIPQFQLLVHLAQEKKLHMQDTTTFIYHHGLRKFELCVLDKESFGDINNISVCFDINPTFAREHGILTVSNSTNSLGVIGTLVRYCLILGNLVYIRAGREPVSAQITYLETNEDGVPMHAICVIKFNGGCTMDIDCKYSIHSGTRQALEIHSDTHWGAMSDFVFPTRSLACYRLHNKQMDMFDDNMVLEGDAIDVENGPLQEVMIWRRFAELSEFVVDQEPGPRGARISYEVSYAALQTQNIVLALTRSMELNWSEVVLDKIDYDIPIF